MTNSNLSAIAAAMTVLNHTFFFRGIAEGSPEYAAIVADETLLPQYDTVERIQVGKDKDGKPVHSKGIKRKPVTVGLRMPEYYNELQDDILRDACFDACVAFVKPFVLEGQTVPEYTWADVLNDYAANNTRSSSGESIKVDAADVKAVSELWLAYLGEHFPKAVGYFGKAVARQCNIKWVSDVLGVQAKSEQLAKVAGQLDAFYASVAKEPDASADDLDIVRAVVAACKRNLDNFAKLSAKPKDVDLSAMFG